MIEQKNTAATTEKTPVDADSVNERVIEEHTPLPVHGNDKSHRPPKDIRDMITEISAYAKLYGLDAFPVIFEMLDYDEINEVAAKGGFPTRYPHWRFGMEYERLSKGYEYGLQKIYEMVINTDPCYAYLMNCNHPTDQKTVIGHVYAHCDFFKNNMWFSQTDRKMLDTMANHATRVRRYMDRYGVARVEAFIDACLSLENLIDQHAMRAPEGSSRGAANQGHHAHDDRVGTGPDGLHKLRSDKDYMDSYINPPEFIEALRKRREEEQRRERTFPSKPNRDVLGFLLNYAPLERWEQDVLGIVRAEAYYFAPQAQTKIMNEGWATYWHTKIMTQKALQDSEIIHFACANAGILATGPGSLNPYKLGVELWRDIEERWDKGRYGKDWEDCDDIVARKTWDKKTEQGQDKIFEVRKIYNDVLFVDEFLTEDFCHRNKMFIYDYNPRTDQYIISDRSFEQVKKRLLFMLTNWGQPRIVVVNANYENRGELYLYHEHEGVDLQLNYAAETLSNTVRLWRRPAHIETVEDGKKVLFSHDGKAFTKTVLH